VLRLVEYLLVGISSFLEDHSLGFFLLLLLPYFSIHIPRLFVNLLLGIFFIFSPCLILNLFCSRYRSTGGVFDYAYNALDQFSASVVATAIIMKLIISLAALSLTISSYMYGGDSYAYLVVSLCLIRSPNSITGANLVSPLLNYIFAGRKWYSIFKSDPIISSGSHSSFTYLLCPIFCYEFPPIQYRAKHSL
jgi:amino acid transporter